MSDNFDFGANFGRKTRKIVRAVLNKTGSYQPILLIFKIKYGVATGYIVCKFEQNRTKITAVRVQKVHSRGWGAQPPIRPPPGKILLTHDTHQTVLI